MRRVWNSGTSTGPGTGAGAGPELASSWLQVNALYDSEVRTSGSLNATVFNLCNNSSLRQSQVTPSHRREYEQLSGNLAQRPQCPTSPPVHGFKPLVTMNSTCMQLK